MAITPDVLDQDTLDTVKSSFTYVKTKVGMPSNVSKEKMRQCRAPVLMMTSGLACLFPAGNFYAAHSQGQNGICLMLK